MSARWEGINPYCNCNELIGVDADNDIDSNTNGSDTSWNRNRFNHGATECH